MNISRYYGKELTEFKQFVKDCRNKKPNSTSTEIALKWGEVYTDKYFKAQATLNHLNSKK